MGVMAIEPAASGSEPAPVRPHGGTEWYRFAREDLGQSHAESVEYANLRYVEECNREPRRRDER